MRFSSDDQLFQQNSKPIEPCQKSQTCIKKGRKQTMLSKFLSSIDEQALSKMIDYQKQKRIIYERNGYASQKIELYEDILLITMFKINQLNIKNDIKVIKTLCLDLESKTKRKQCTIKERIQKKLCKLSVTQILQHIHRDKDISFNQKKQLTSGNKLQSNTKSPTKTQQPQIKTQQPQVKTQSKQQIINQQNNEMINEDKQEKSFISPVKQSKDSLKLNGEEIFQEIQQNNMDKENKQINIQLNNQQKAKKKTSIKHQPISTQQGSISLQQLNLQEEKKRKIQLLKQALKGQLQSIKAYTDRQLKKNVQIHSLIQQAYIMIKGLGISDNEIKDLLKESPQTPTPKQIDSQQPTCTPTCSTSQSHPTTSQFSLQNSSTLQHSLCNNSQYIKLYKTNPQVFERLVWTNEQDQIIQELVKQYKGNQDLFKMLIKHKSPELFVQRCVYLNKLLINTQLLEQLRTFKPFNINQLQNKLKVTKQHQNLHQQHKMQDLLQAN